jgi:chromosome partitioning protein
MEAKIIAVANQKGGVGKTTCCVNLASTIGSLNNKVLLIDLDPQGNATMACGYNKLAANYTIGDVLQEKITIEQAIVEANGVNLIPSNIDVTEAEVNLLKHSDREHKLSKILGQIATKYDFIFIDCPPSLNILTLNALLAANSVFIPMQCEYYALEGLSSLVKTIEDIKNLNQKLHIEGIVRTMYDARNKLCQDVSAQLIQHFPNLVYDTFIPRNIRLAEAPSYGLPILLYDKQSKGAQSYLSLAKELLQANQQVATNSIENPVKVNKETLA